MASKLFVYPPTMEAESERPVLVLRSVSKVDQHDTHIVFPIPGSIQFTDSASYDNTSIGFTGSLAMSGMRSSNLSEASSNVQGSFAAAMPKSVREGIGLANNLLLNNRINDKVGSAIGIAAGTTLNRNIVTEFTGIGTRQFTFQVKMVSTSAAESRTIRDIINTFRLGLYPSGTNLQLTYPPTWRINFKQNGKDISYIPRIFETYLTTMNTAYNSSTNMFHKDGSPVETDLTLTFMETRALTKKDIENLIDHEFQDSESVNSWVAAGEANIANVTSNLGRFVQDSSGNESDPNFMGPPSSAAN